MLGAAALMTTANITCQLNDKSPERRKSIEQLTDQVHELGHAHGGFASLRSSSSSCSSVKSTGTKSTISRQDSSITEFDFDSFSSLANSLYDYCASRPILYCVGIYLGFIIIGILFFSCFFGWNFGTAYYMAMGTGLNIGPCQPALGPPNGVMIFTVFYILIGSTVIAGSVGFGLSTIIYTRVDLINIDHSDISMYTNNIETLEQELTLRSFSHYIWTKCKYYAGWYHYRTRTICVIIGLVWLFFGVVFGMYGLGYDFLTSLYWALGTASTAGFYAPECINGTEGETCDMGQVRGTVMAMYMTFGCPIYAATMAQVFGYFWIN